MAREGLGGLSRSRCTTSFEIGGSGELEEKGFLKDCHVAEDLEVAYSEETVEAYRVAFHVTKEEEVRTSLGQCRSLLYFNLSNKSDVMERAKLFQYFRHLRVLYVHTQNGLTLPREISLMRYLRYLGLGGKATYFHPSSIGDLLSLETLYAPYARVYDIPISLWKIPTLRQVHIPRCESWSMSWWISSLSKVQAVVGYDGTDTSVMKRMIEATKHQVSKSKNSSFSFCFIADYNSSSYSELEVAGRYGEVVRFPDTLTHITNMRALTALKICCFNLCSNDQNILELGCLDLLMVLEIGERSYTGSIMTFPSGSFHRLERLVLHDLVVEDWKIEDGSMRRLLELTLCKCPNLTRLPEGLLLLPNLVKVELIAMPPDCYQQGTVIQELKEMGCVVSILSDEKDFEHLDLP